MDVILEDEEESDRAITPQFSSITSVSLNDDGLVSLNNDTGVINDGIIKIPNFPEGLSTTPKVAVRCRPFRTNEKNSAATRIVKINGNQLLLHNPTSGSVKEHNFNFDNCYFWEAKTNNVYKEVAEPLLGKALEGFNVGILTYGQTGCGKSFTLNGTLEEDGIITMVSQMLFNIIEETASIKEHFVLVSYLQIKGDVVLDLINPSGRDLKVRNHPQLGLYVDDMAEVHATCTDDIIRFCDQGNRIRTLTTDDITESQRSSSIFTITVEQRMLSGNQKGLRSAFSFIDLTGSEHTSKAEDAPYISNSLNQLQQVVSVLNEDNHEHVPYRESKLTRLLQNYFGGNGYMAMIAHISPTDSDYAETLSTLKFTTQVKSIDNKPKKNENDTSVVLNSLRNEIGQLREVISKGSNSMIDMPNTDDVARMEELIKDLQVLKLQTWEEKLRISEMFLEERKHHLSNKGILDMVQDSMKRDGKEIDAHLSQLAKDKERLMLEYNEKKSVVVELKDKLQEKITEYTKLTEKGKGNEEEGKSTIKEIQDMKEKLKQLNEGLKKIKGNLKDNQTKHKTEKEEAKLNANSLKGNMELRFKLEAENREKLEKDNQAALAEEVDRIEMETAQEKAELKLKMAEGKTYSTDEMIKIEMEMLVVKAEKSTMAIKLRSLETEKKHLQKDLNELFKRQKEELEIQQLQHFQTFRVYREAFEDQKAALEQRYRTLLEDSIQDAVYLSSTNQELIDENQSLKQEIAEMKDKLTVLSGRPMSAE